MHVSSSSSYLANDLPAAREIINKALDLVQVEWDKAVAVSAASYPPIAKIEPCNLFGGRRSMDAYESEVKGNYSYSRPPIERVVAHATKIADDWKATAESRHIANLPGLQSNAKLATALKALMESVGMPKTYSSKEEGRGYRNYKTITHDAGYLGDISRAITIHDGYETVKRDYDEMIRQIEEYATKRRAEEQKVQREAEAATKAKEDLRAVGVLLGKYGLSVDKDASDLLDAILAKDKYLYLAHYLAMNRGDWSDGYNYAKIGLRGFMVETLQDGMIHDEIEGLINQDDSPDGRCFRDCVWSYDVLFALVPSDLKADYDKVSAMKEVS